MSNEMHNIFNGPRLDDRQITELIGLARGIVADGVVTQAEAETLQTWLAANAGITGNLIVCNLLRRINAMLSDKVLDSEESAELLETLQDFTGGDLELGEPLKSSTLPLDEPPPEITIPESRFCFTGTFAFGPRSECQTAVERLGGICGSLTKKTNYLVIGVYATESWVHSSYGRKIERAIEMKYEGLPIQIVGEPHWRRYLTP